MLMFLVSCLLETNEKKCVTIFRIFLVKDNNYYIVMHMYYKIYITYISYQDLNVSHIYFSKSRCEMKWLGRVPDIVFQSL